MPGWALAIVDDRPVDSPPAGDVGRRRRPFGSWDPSDQVVDESLELAEVAALEHAVAVDAVVPDDRVTGVPVRLRLGVEPVDVAGPVLDLLDHPGLRGVVVVPRV